MLKNCKIHQKLPKRIYSQWVTLDVLAKIFLNNRTLAWVLVDVFPAIFDQNFVLFLDQDGMQLFAFHGKVNEDISRIEPGQYSGDFKSPSKGRWTYFNEDLVLKPGDKISYWIFIQHDKSGYRKDNQKWTVSGCFLYIIC